MSNTGIRQYGRSNLPGANSGIRIQSQDIADFSLNRRKFNDRHQYFNFRNQPVAMLKGATGAVAAGTTGAVNILSIPAEGALEQHILGAGQTLIVPTLVADGLEISGDQTNDEGCELCAGTVSRVPSYFVVGTDPAFSFRVRAVIDDVSGTDSLLMGWRKVQAYQASYASYTDFAALLLDGGQWKSVTNLNNGGVTTTTLTGYTVADLGAFEVQINVSASGAVTYEVGTAGSRSVPGTAPAFTLDSGDGMVPFLYFLHHTDLADSIRLRQWEAGFATEMLV
jgi:hypothetical protein